MRGTYNEASGSNILKGNQSDSPWEQDFRNRMASLRDASCFKVFDSPDLTGDRLEAMKFLYAYLPLPDMVCYSPEFFLESVDASLRAREEMPWGSQIPDREFRHFVLPLRVNNEMLDGSRPIFYEELKERVKGLTIEEAILEVNHWCHEKVTYQPSDGRTSNPLSTVSQAIGRCGEESTFTVAALRSVGIPARQIYTPRWAHTDDNHAWVEAWANGKWHFLGACEPEPVLDLGWFNMPASRGLIMTTNVFGKYDGPEEKLKETDITTSINVTSNYAPTGILRVRVLDDKGRPVKDASAVFSIYNYVDFYPVATRQTDSEGYTEIVCGFGDMVVWGVKDGRFGFIKARPEDGKVWDLVIDKDGDYAGEFELDIVPPAGSRSLPLVTPEEREANDRRLAVEDSIRKSYVATFINSKRAEDIAESHGWDKEKTKEIFTKARGNSLVIHHFLDSLNPGAELERGLDLLAALSEKDLRDVRADVLEDNMKFTPERGEDVSKEIFDSYLLNPRVEYEWLVPYKSFFNDHIDAGLQKEARRNPEFWVRWIKDNIVEETVYNPQGIHISPIAVWNQKRGDARSINIMFVASMRSMGIPARIDPMTGKTQYYGNDGWIDVSLEPGLASGGDSAASQAAPRVGKGKVTLTYGGDGNVKNPLYYSHFSVHKITDGNLEFLEFDDGYGVEEVSEQLHLNPGQYMLMTGQRMSDGSVLVNGKFFPVNEGENVQQEIVLRKDSEKVSIIGSLNAENLYYDEQTGKDKSILSTTGRGNYILGIIKSNSEPSAHALNDISLRKDDFEALDSKMVVLFRNSDDMARFDKDRFPNLPSTLIFGVDNDSVSLSELVESLSLTDDNLPLFVIADSFNRVMFVSQGYTIGLGDKLLEVMSKINSD